MTNIEVIQKCYEYFRCGDGPSLLALFDPKIEFRLAEGHPYQINGKAWTGPEEVGREFLMKAGPDWENWDIAIANILESNGSVVVEGRYAGIFKPTGRRMDVQVCHVWRLANGRVTSFHQYADTARLQTVMSRPEPSRS